MLSVLVVMRNPAALSRVRYERLYGSSSIKVWRTYKEGVKNEFEKEYLKHLRTQGHSSVPLITLVIFQHYLGIGHADRECLTTGEQRAQAETHPKMQMMVKYEKKGISASLGLVKMT